MNMVWVGITVVTAVSGVLLGAGLSWSVIKRRARLRERRLMAAAQEHHINSTRSLRSANTRLQLELETERSSMQRRVAAGLSEQRAAAIRLEEQLRFAYREIDRLKEHGGVVTPRAAVAAPREDGFALTQPFVP